MLVLREVSIFTSADINISKNTQKSPQMTVKREESFVKFLAYLLPHLQDLAAWCLFLLLLEMPEFLSLLWMQIVVPGEAVSRMWRAAKRHHVELQGSPAAMWNPAPGLHKCLSFQSLAAPRADIKAQLSLSPAVLQHSYPAAFSPPPPIWDLHGDPILSFILHMTCVESSIALEELLYLPACSARSWVFIITVQCLSENGLQILNYME